MFYRERGNIATVAPPKKNEGIKVELWNTVRRFGYPAEQGMSSILRSGTINVTHSPRKISIFPLPDKEEGEKNNTDANSSKRCLLSRWFFDGHFTSPLAHYRWKIMSLGGR